VGVLGCIYMVKKGVLWVFSWSSCDVLVLFPPLLPYLHPSCYIFTIIDINDKNKTKNNQTQKNCCFLQGQAFVMPKSPQWLVFKNCNEGARGVLRLVYPGRYDVNVIVCNIKDGIKKEVMAEHAVGW
jgi:hypothetical protein